MGATGKSQYFKEFEFDNWANKRYLEFLSENEISSERIVRILAHIFSAQILWINRIRSHSLDGYNLWEVYPLETMQKMSSQAHLAWREFIKDYPDDEFSELISYTNTQGLSFETPLDEIIRHVLYHGTYHRGQLAVLIRDLNFTPPYTDYVAFIRGQ